MNAAALRFTLRKPTSRRRASRRLIIETLENRTLLAALPDAVPGEILVGLGADFAALVQKDGPGKALQSAANRYRDLGLERGEMLMNYQAGLAGHDRLLTLWKLPTGKDVAETARELSKLPGVAYAEPNYILSTATIPTDPSFSSLWGLHNTGQSLGTPDADIDAREAWDIATGSSEVIVGVIDTGVDYNHPDLAANIWTNTAEFAGAAGVDDDGNGYIDDVHGWNALTNTGNPLDDNNHGTHVAGTIGGVGNNGVGVVGVNHDVSIAACKFLSATGTGPISAAIVCFQYFNKLRAAGHNIVITNNSWGGGGFSQALADAMAGPILHAVAAGNANNNNDTTPSFPASYGLDNIIAVASTDRNDRYAGTSSYGSTSVDLAAPGVSILSTTRNNTYSVFSGTSMATPHVAGAAALISSVRPDLTALELKAALMGGTDFIGGIGANSSKPTVTNGRLNVHKTLINLGLSAVPSIRVSPSSGLVTTESGGTATFTIVLTTPPTDDVVIPVSSSELDEGTVLTQLLTFTPESWDISQTVTVVGVDDALTDGDRSYTIITDPAVSGDLLYNGFDPTDVGVTNRDNDAKFYVVNDATTNLTYEYSATGSAIENYAANSGNTAPRGAASNVLGDTVWVVDANRKVFVYDTTDGFIGSWSVDGFNNSAQFTGIATNGTDIWIVDAKSDKVYRFTGAASRTLGSQSAASSFALNSGNKDASDLVTDGTYLWVVNDANIDKVFRYTIANPTVGVGSWTISTASPTGITLEPGNSASPLWIVDNANDSVYQFAQPTLPSGSPLTGSVHFALAPGNTNPQGIADPPSPSIGGLTTPLTASSADPSHDTALLSIVGELDGLLTGGKKRK